MVSEITLLRERKGGIATKSYVHNGVVIGNIRVLTGTRNQPDSSEWERKVSGIPIGDHWLWNFKKYIKQYNELDPKGREIGRFYPISSSKTNERLIEGINGKQRWDIGQHCDNDFPFSLGCPVTVSHPLWITFCKHMDDTPEGHILYKVRWAS